MTTLFNTSNMINHPNPMMKGIKQFKVEFANGEYVSAIGGSCRVMSVQGDGVNDFELGYSKGESTEVEPYVEIERINEVISEYCELFGKPVRINSKTI
jgi:hypothetical protein